MVNGRPAAFVPACCLDRDELSNLRGATRSPQRATGSFVTDAALSANSAALPRLLAFADARPMMLGSDFPFAPLPGAQILHRQFDNYNGLYEAKLDAINRANALSLFSAAGTK